MKFSSQFVISLTHLKYSTLPSSTTRRQLYGTFTMLFSSFPQSPDMLSCVEVDAAVEGVEGDMEPRPDSSFPSASEDWLPVGEDCVLCSQEDALTCGIQLMVVVRGTVVWMVVAVVEEMLQAEVVTVTVVVVRAPGLTLVNAVSFEKTSPVTGAAILTIGGAATTTLLAVAAVVKQLWVEELTTLTPNTVGLPVCCRSTDAFPAHWIFLTSLLMLRAVAAGIVCVMIS